MAKLVEQLTINQVQTETVKEKLKRREHVWLNKLKALEIHGLKQKLNQIQEKQFLTFKFFIHAA